MNSLDSQFVDLLLCLLPLVAFAFSLHRTWIARRWPEIQATVISCKKVMSPHPGVGGGNVIFSVSAEYQIGGSPYRIKFGYPHEIRGTVPIFINPSDPGDFIAERRGYGYPILWGTISVMLIFYTLV